MAKARDIDTVCWTKIILETFLEESGINDRIELGDDKARIMEAILRTRCAGWKISKQALEFHCSESTIKNYLKEIDELYNATQKNSIILPTGKMNSKTQMILDE